MNEQDHADQDQDLGPDRLELWFQKLVEHTETETGVAYKDMVVARPETFSNPVTSAVLSNSRATAGTSASRRT